MRPVNNCSEFGGGIGVDDDGSTMRTLEHRPRPTYWKGAVEGDVAIACEERTEHAGKRGRTSTREYPRQWRAAVGRRLP